MVAIPSESRFKQAAVSGVGVSAGVAERGASWGEAAAVGRGRGQDTVLGNCKGGRVSVAGVPEALAAVAAGGQPLPAQIVAAAPKNPIICTKRRCRLNVLRPREVAVKAWVGRRYPAAAQNLREEEACWD
jgi:hypothetical protein